MSFSYLFSSDADAVVGFVSISFTNRNERTPTGLWYDKADLVLVDESLDLLYMIHESGCVYDADRVIHNGAVSEIKTLTAVSWGRVRGACGPYQRT